MFRIFEFLNSPPRRRGAETSKRPCVPLCLCVSAVNILFLASPLVAQQADWIWSARYVITEDAQHRVIENGAVAIRGDRIVGVGTRADIDARFQAKQRLDR